MSELTPNITEEREAFLKRLQQQVDSAFQQRDNVTYLTKKRATKEGLAKKEATSATVQELLDKGVDPVDITINHSNLPLKPFQVAVEHSHDYKDLLFMALKKIYPPEKMSDEKRKKTVAEILEHEYAHAVPGLNQEGLEMRYGIGFFEDKKQHFIGFQPAIFLNGKVSYAIDLAMTQGPHNPSAGDLLDLSVGK